MARRLTFDTRPGRRVAGGEYAPLRFSTAPPEMTLVRRIASALLNYYLGSNLSVSQWRKQGTVETPATWNPPDRPPPGRVRFDDLCRAIADQRGFDAGQGGFPPLTHNWLDSAVAMAPGFTYPSNEDLNVALVFKTQPSDLPPRPTGAGPGWFPWPPPRAYEDLDGESLHFKVYNYGASFPYRVAIDREGTAFSSLQLQFQGLLLEARKQVVATCQSLLTPSEAVFLNLLGYLTVSIALLDITFYQLYWKARCDHQREGWKFEPARIGRRFNRPIEEKLRWVYQITGRRLETTPSEREALDMLRKVRNHFTHFDPPLLAYTIEDVAEWLNCTYGLASLLWKVRENVGVPLSEPIVSLLLAPRVEWVATDLDRRRVPQREGIGFSGCVKPSDSRTAQRTWLRRLIGRTGEGLERAGIWLASKSR